MRDVISELRELARHDESEFTRGAVGYRAIDEMAVELETAEFLFSLVRLLRPAIVLESGAGRGYSTLAIAGALERNGAGYLWSFEPDPEYRSIAEQRVADMSCVSVISGDSRQHSDNVSLVFLDSGPQ
ncbi:MAG: class I SAM-dependent methyltransferase, partial [Rhodothermales bacterium]|nr:class I SAM-dependent methyltransferase [Rhodothermales bacterium]